jgi:hypothetical protein
MNALLSSSASIWIIAAVSTPGVVTRPRPQLLGHWLTRHDSLADGLAA